MTPLVSGFYISKVSVSGPGKRSAILEFKDGLNVVCGASDTGKSFAVSCIDFGFGASKPPRPIPELSGYHTVTLELSVRGTAEHIAIERGVAGGDVRVVRQDSSGKVLKDDAIPFKHNAKDSETLSGLLLNLSGLWGRQIRKNKTGERRSLSFRDVAYLISVDEERIIAERPPQLSDSYTDRTVESEVFRSLITGNESGAVVVVPGKEDTAGIDAKIDLLGSMIEDGAHKIQTIGLTREALEKELSEMEAMRQQAMASYEDARLNVTQLETELKTRAQMLRDIDERDAVVEGLLSRFTLLDAHYTSDIARLAAIEETGVLLQALPSKPCPVCGAMPEAHRLNHAIEQFELPVVQLAAKSERQKASQLKADLSRVLNELVQEQKQLQNQRKEAERAADALQTQIAEELMPRVKESAETLKGQNDRRDILLIGKSLLDNVEQLRKQQSELEGRRAEGKSSVPKINSTASTGEMDAFAQTVEAILKAWNYPKLGRVVFSETNQDLVIGNHPRSSHGKGVRALTCAAFVIGIMQHCKTKSLPHPYLSVLDSPLVAYQEADSDGEAKSLRQAGVKEAFYSSLASGLVAGQMIIFENEDPPTAPTETFVKHHFTGTTAGRQGFFPVSQVT
jgi:hypothetical protein